MPDIAIADSANPPPASKPRSPLGHATPIHRPGCLTLSQAADTDRLLLRGDRNALRDAYAIDLPATPCRAVSAEGRTALWLGPDEWLLLAQPGALPAVASLEGAAVIDIGHRQIGLLLEGPASAEALATGCPLDLHPSAFPPGMCTRTVFGKAEIVLWRQQTATFHLEVWRSFAAYVHERLAVAAADLEYDPTIWDHPSDRHARQKNEARTLSNPPQSDRTLAALDQPPPSVRL